MSDTPELANRENSPGLFEWLDMLARNPDILADFVDGLTGVESPASTNNDNTTKETPCLNASHLP